MTRTGYSAGALGALCESSPSKGTINRWLREGKASPDGRVKVRRDSIDTIARKLAVDSTLLCDDPSETGEELLKMLNFAAALGPRVYPPLLRLFGFSEALEAFAEASGAFGRLIPDEPVSYRQFRRWSTCEQYLVHARLDADQARRARYWLAAYQLEPEDFPEIHCLIALYEDRLEDAFRCGSLWMTRARMRGALAEVCWVGRRLLVTTRRAGGEFGQRRISLAIATAEALRLHGFPDDALQVLSEDGIILASGTDPVRHAEYRLERAAVQFHRGHGTQAVQDIERLVDSLAAESNPATNRIRSSALMELLHLHQLAGERKKANEVSLALRRATGYPGASFSRIYRLLGIEALQLGEISKAVRFFRDALDLAESQANAREIGLGHLNIGVAYAIQGRFDRASNYFERAISDFTGAEAGNLSLAFCYLNFAEADLDQGKDTDAYARAQTALREFQRAGDQPLYLTRTHVLLAEVSLFRGDLRAALTHAQEANFHAASGVVEFDQVSALLTTAAAMAGDAGIEPAFIRVLRSRVDDLPVHTPLLDRLTVQRRLALVLALHVGYEAGADLLGGGRAQALELGLGGVARRFDRTLRYLQERRTAAR